ncbi:MAG: VWA domain-containing protein [Myxococcales bacterium]|nr:VWA domain-containing protein [Myxococcales bacterium]
MSFPSDARLGWSWGLFSLTLFSGVASCPNDPPTADIPDLALAPDLATLSPAQCLAQLSQCVQNKNPAPHAFVDVTKNKEIDLLFVIDNSVSMSPKQRVLAQAIPQFLQKIDGTGASYHIGVVTSDVGTLPPGQTGWPGSTEVRCATQKGDDGRLQNKACTSRVLPPDMATEFAMACRNGATPLCPDASFVPNDLWISKSGSSVNVTPTNPGALTASQIAQRAFQCIGLVGDYGCGVEAPLESMKRALDGHLPEHQGFLRPNSVLSINIITDEDDASVQLSQRQYLNPAAMSCSTANPDPDYPCFNLDYRAIAKSTQCDQSMATPGLKTNCRERPGTFLEPVTTYAKFLQTLRPPGRMVIAGIISPSLQDFQARGNTGDGRLEVEGFSGDVSTQVLNRGSRTKAACFNPDPTLTTDPRGFFGQAQHRLSSFFRSFDASSRVEKSICDPPNYASILDTVASKVATALGADCLSDKPLVENGTPLCQVGFVDASRPMDVPASALAQCGNRCCQAWATSATPNRGDASIQAACAAETADCFCAPSSAVQCIGTAVAGLWRVGNADLPAGQTASFRCISSL